jgi:hypothetical protein
MQFDGEKVGGIGSEWVVQRGPFVPESPILLILPTVLTIGCMHKRLFLPSSSSSSTCLCGSPHHHARHGVHEGVAPDDNAGATCESIVDVCGAHLHQKQGFLKDVVPQIPLSVLNFVVVVCKLTHDLFLKKAVSTTLVSVTMGGYWSGVLTNLLGCWFGRRASTSSTSTTVVRGGVGRDQASVEAEARELIL